MVIRFIVYFIGNAVRGCSGQRTTRNAGFYLVSPFTMTEKTTPLFSFLVYLDKSLLVHVFFCKEYRSGYMFAW